MLYSMQACILYIQNICIQISILWKLSLNLHFYVYIFVKFYLKFNVKMSDNTGVISVMCLYARF